MCLQRNDSKAIASYMERYPRASVSCYCCEHKKFHVLKLYKEIQYMIVYILCIHHHTSSLHHGISACISHSTPRRRDVDIHIRLPCIQVMHSHAIAICIIGVRTFGCEWKIIQSCSTFANADMFHVTTQVVWSKSTVKKGSLFKSGRHKKWQKHSWTHYSIAPSSSILIPCTQQARWVRTQLAPNSPAKTALLGPVWMECYWLLWTN